MSAKSRRSVGERKAISTETHLERLSAVSRPTIDRYIDRLSTECRPTIEVSWFHMCLIDQSPCSISTQEIAELLKINILFETD